MMMMMMIYIYIYMSVIGARETQNFTGVPLFSLTFRPEAFFRE